MSKETKHDLIVGLDIGTSKIVAMVAELNPEGQLMHPRHRQHQFEENKDKRPQEGRGRQHRGDGRTPFRAPSRKSN